MAGKLQVMKNGFGDVNIFIQYSLNLSYLVCTYVLDHPILLLCHWHKPQPLRSLHIHHCCYWPERQVTELKKIESGQLDFIGLRKTFDCLSNNISAVILLLGPLLFLILSLTAALKPGPELYPTSSNLKSLSESWSCKEGALAQQIIICSSSVVCECSPVNIPEGLVQFVHLGSGHESSLLLCPAHTNGVMECVSQCKCINALYLVYTWLSTVTASPCLTDSSLFPGSAVKSYRTWAWCTNKKRLKHWICGFRKFPLLFVLNFQHHKILHLAFKLNLKKVSCRHKMSQNSNFTYFSGLNWRLETDFCGLMCSKRLCWKKKFDYQTSWWSRIALSTAPGFSFLNIPVCSLNKFSTPLHLWQELWNRLRFFSAPYKYHCLDVYTSIYSRDCL